MRKHVGHTTGQQPLARSTDLVVHTVGDGQLLVYDNRHHHIHQLPAPVADVWQRCFGLCSTELIAAQAGIPHAGVVAAVDQLADAGLLAGAVPGARTSRRRLLRKTAIAAGIAIPAITSITAPAGATYLSTNPPVIGCTPGTVGCFCTSDGQCDNNGYCVDGVGICAAR